MKSRKDIIDYLALPLAIVFIFSAHDFFGAKKPEKKHSTLILIDNIRHLGKWLVFIALLVILWVVFPK